MRSRFFIAAITFFLSLVMHPEVQAEGPRKPNIIYILLDDAGYADLSCYGQQKFSTPNIDSLADKGMKFIQHYSGSTVCAPTRCCLMTGQHTGHSVVRGNREVQPEGQAPMPADVVTIPRLLRQAGYTSGMFGKWGLGAPGSSSDPMEHFDVFYGYNCQRKAHSYYPESLWSNREKIMLNGESYAHDLIIQQALKFIRDHQAGPFFLYVPVTVPHAALQVPAESHDRFRTIFQEFDNVEGKYAGSTITNPAAAFAGMMTRLDSQIGEMLKLISELELEENTLFMLSSDNGPHQEGGHMPDFFDSNGPFRGHKRDLYEGGIRTPLLAMWKGTIEPGSYSAMISAHWDMLPTFCELAGVTPPTDIDGISLMAELKGDHKSQRQHDYLYWEFQERGRSQAVRKGDWKAVRNNIKADPEAPIELYNLTEDLGEEIDLAEQYEDVVAEMDEIMKAAHTPSTTFPLFESEAAQSQ